MATKLPPRHLPRACLSGLAVPALAFALAGGAAGCIVYPATPSDPTFEADVRPIFLAHCTRCHGNGPDGGTPANPNNFNTSSVPNYDAVGCPTMPTGPNLTKYGPCTVADGGGASGCHFTVGSGAATYAAQIELAIHATSCADDQMPPAPAPRLNDWEMKVIDAWVAEKPIPICSNSPNPDPAICPPGK